MIRSFSFSLFLECPNRIRNYSSVEQQECVDEKKKKRKKRRRLASVCVCVYHAKSTVFDQSG